MSIPSTTPFLQFGTSRFLQAHVDLFLSEALERGRALGPVTVVQSSGDGERRKRLSALADPSGFPVRIQGLELGKAVSFESRVTSIARALSTEVDWKEICRIASDEVEIILSNSGDSGWKRQSADSYPLFQQSMSYPAKLTHLLLARFRASAEPVQVMPTELVSRNGDQLKIRVVEIAEALDTGFTDWVCTHVRFVNSLVDRIVSAALEPAGAVAEPYALWAIENVEGLVVPCMHPNVQVVHSLDLIEKLKLHILNLGHTYLVSRWIEAGKKANIFVRDMMNDSGSRTELASIYEAEVLPTFAAWGHQKDAADYVAVTMERFANPYLDHRLSDIAQNHGEKVQRRVKALLDWSDKLDVPRTQFRLRAVVRTSI